MVFRFVFFFFFVTFHLEDVAPYILFSVAPYAVPRHRWCGVCGPLFAVPSNLNTCNAQRGLLRCVDLGSDDNTNTHYANVIDMSGEGLAWLDEGGWMWEAAEKDAAERKFPVDDYLNQIVTNIQILQVGRSLRQEEAS